MNKKTDNEKLHQMAVGFALRYMRKRTGIPLYEIEIRIGTSNMSLSRWERGVNDIPSNKLQALASLYGTTGDNIIALANDITEIVEKELIDRVSPI